MIISGHGKIIAGLLSVSNCSFSSNYDLCQPIMNLDIRSRPAHAVYSTPVLPHFDISLDLTLDTSLIMYDILYRSLEV